MLNVVLSRASLKPNAPVRVPYSPNFITQVKDGNVNDIDSKSDSITGHFNKPVKYPADSTSKPTKNFTTQVPSFANNRQLSTLLRRARRDPGRLEPQQRARRRSSRSSSAFGPTLLILLLLFFVFRAVQPRAAAAPAD